MEIHWREKFRAFAIHFLLTALVAAAAAWLVFGEWFPDPFDALAGGFKLFLLISCCDLVLGPLLSLVVYDSRKSRGKLLFDYVVIAALQLGSLTYGISIMSGARPVYVVFVSDRLEVVAAADLTKEELAAARDPQYARVPFTGVRFVALDVPPGESQKVMFDALNGKEEASRPQYYAAYESALPQIVAKAKELSALASRHPNEAADIAAARAAAGVPDEHLRWLPVRFGQAFWTALIDTRTGKPARYLELDPY